MSATQGARVAVVGNGPRALWALERLDAYLGCAGAVPPSEVHVFGPGDLGAGSNYNSSQPDYLRLNVASSGVDAWRGENERGQSLDAWRDSRAPGSTRDAFPPRALTGVYLREQAERVRGSLDRHLGSAVVVHGAFARRLRRSAHGWGIDGHGPFDEVLLAVGHAADWPGALHHHWPSSLAALHPRVYPVADLLARPELRPGSTVVIRGAALTAIDAVLALTLGRGRRPADSDLRIVLSSRTGRLMLPKMDPQVLAPTLTRLGDLSETRRAVAEGEDVSDLVGEVAVRLLGDDRNAAQLVDRAIAALLDGADENDDSVRFLDHGVAMAEGRRPPDGAWALGQAWRLLYPDLVRRQRARKAGFPLGWEGYADWSRELERLAFGPPLVNARLLLEGLESGTVCVKRDPVSTLARDADLVIDAVLAPPGVAQLPADDLLGRLRDSGLLCHDATRRGARVAADATVIDASGTCVAGLALVGRATEDELLGNDTLIRELHPEVDRWAQRVLCLSLGERA